jgi:hypothetical protein
LAEVVEDVVAPFDHRYVNGEAPPVTETEAVAEVWDEQFPGEVEHDAEGPDVVYTTMELELTDAGWAHDIDDVITTQT